MKKTKWDVNKAKEYCLNVGSEFLSDEYINNKTQYNFKCTCCGKPFKRSFTKFKNANQTRCLECSKKSVINLNRIGDEYIYKYVNENSKSNLLDITYRETSARKNKILHLKCNCGIEYTQVWETFKKSKFKTCGECSLKLKAKERALSLEQVLIEISSYGLELKSDYKNIDSDIKLRCDCGNIFITSLYKIRKSIYKTCKLCDNKRNSKRQSMTHEEFLKRFSEIEDSNEYEILSEYVKSSKKIKIKHLKCGRIYEVNPNNFINRGNRCICNNISKGEKKILNYLKNNNITYETQKYFKLCKNIRPLPFDFYLPEYNIAIEMQGQLHEEKLRHSHFGNISIQTKTDLIKQRFCRENELKLIHIWWYEMPQINKILKYLLKI